MNGDWIKYEKDGEIARIIFDRPEKHNAMFFANARSPETKQFIAYMDEVEEDDEVKVLILKGNGPSFCTGEDLGVVGSEFGQATTKQELTEKRRRPSQKMLLDFARGAMIDEHRKFLLLHKVTIGQVHGYCYGVGASLLGYCDIGIASDDCKIGWPENRFAFAGIMDHMTLAHEVGLKRMKEMMFIGGTVNAHEAEKMGLVNKVVPRDKLEEEVNRWAKAICLLPRDGIAIAKAQLQFTYDRLGLIGGFYERAMCVSMLNRMQFQPGEYQLYKVRAEKGPKEAIRQLHEAWNALGFGL